MPPLHEFFIVDSPEGAKVVLNADEALVQRQIRADRVLEEKQKLDLRACRVGDIKGREIVVQQAATCGAGLGLS